MKGVLGGDNAKQHLKEIDSFLTVRNTKTKDELLPRILAERSSFDNTQPIFVDKRKQTFSRRAVSIPPKTAVGFDPN